MKLSSIHHIALLVLSFLLFTNLSTTAKERIDIWHAPSASVTINPARQEESLWEKIRNPLAAVTIAASSAFCAPAALIIIAGVAISLGVDAIKERSAKKSLRSPPVAQNHNPPLEKAPTARATCSFKQESRTLAHIEHNQAPAQALDREYILSQAEDIVPIEVLTERLRAVEEHNRHPNSSTEKIHYVSEPATHTIARYQIPLAHYQQCTGSLLQQTIHSECIQIIDRAATCKPLENTQLEHHIIEFVDIGREYNQNGQTTTAFKSLDLCWGLLKCAYAVLDGTTDGIIELAESAIYAGKNPIRATKEFIRSAAETGKCLVLLLDEINNLIETKGGQLLGFDTNTDRADAFIESCAQTTQELASYIKNNPYDAIKQLSKSATQAYLTGKVLGGVQKLITSAATQAPQHFDTIKFIFDHAPDISNIASSGTIAINTAHSLADLEIINTIPLAITYNAMNRGTEKYGTRKSNDKKYDSKKETQNNPVPNKHPHGKYKDASYHHQNSSGKKSPAPKDGQLALDHSVGIPSNHPNKTRRVGTSNGEIVVLDQTSPGLYHGHVRTWQEIEKSPSMINIRNVLLKYNLVDKFGNIL